MKTLVVLVGPTGVGKTECCLSLARTFQTVIVNADSRQLYAGMRIGTAAPTAEQMAEAQHFFVGTLALTDYYSAARYEEEAMKLLGNLFMQHDIVLLSGGSMMYIDAVCKGIDDIPTITDETRQLLMERYRREGLEQLCAELRVLDAAYYKEVDLKNPKRVIHALEVCYQTGRTYSSFRTNTAKPRPFRIVKIGLTRPREELYERINARVEQMMRDGLEQEARRLLPYRQLNSLNTVGYKELFPYFDGEYSLDAAVEMIKSHSRMYSRKQMTWFKRDQDIRWFHPDETGCIVTYLQQAVQERSSE